MNKIYEDASDVHVIATRIYKKDGDLYAYADSAKTVKIDVTALKDLFEKGAIIVDGTGSYAPVSFEIVSNHGVIGYVSVDDVTPTATAFKSLVSSEYVAG